LFFACSGCLLILSIIVFFPEEESETGLSHMSQCLV
jgi:hypothetical protein